MKASLFFVLFLSLLAVLATPARAQQQGQSATTAAASTSPNAGQDPPAVAARDASENPKNSRIFMVIPNYTTVEKPTATITRLSAKQKFKLGAEDAFDPYSFPL